MHVRQCPKCKILFPGISELKNHLATDHPDFEVAASAAQSGI
jgi:hypothetical protein